MTDKTKEGWGYSDNLRNWHYFQANGMSLCRKIVFHLGAREQRSDNSRDNCPKCRKMLAEKKEPKP